MELIESFKVAATLTSQRIVAPISGTANSVQYPTTITSSLIGITADDVEETTQAIPVKVAGIAKLLFNDTCTSGGQVAGDTSGRGIPFAGLTNTSTWVIGTLIGDSVSATNTVAKVLINPKAIYSV